MAAQLSAQSRIKRAQHRIGWTTAGLVAGAAVLLTITASNHQSSNALSSAPWDLPYGKLACADVRPHFEQLQRQLARPSDPPASPDSPAGENIVAALDAPMQGPLEDGMVKQLVRHLTDCRRCRTRFQQIYPGLLQSATRSSLTGLGQVSIAAAVWAAW
jgi:hypothetical protein